MSQYVIDKRDFLKGLSQSEEIGGFFRDMQGINVHSKSGVGILMNNSSVSTVYSEASATALTSPITQIIGPIGLGGTSSIKSVIALSNNHAVRLQLSGADSETISIIEFAGGNSIDKTGAALYHFGSQSSSGIGLFYSSASDIGAYDTSGTFTTEQKWNVDFMTTVPANDGAPVLGSRKVRYMYHHRGHDILYFNGGTGQGNICKFDANIGVNGTFSEDVLDLPKDWEVRGFGQLRDYLAILAVNPLTGSADDPFMQFRSKIFFWDGIKDSWTYETPEIADDLLRLKNTEDGLFAIGKGDGITYYQIEFEQAKRIFNWVGNVDITSGRRNDDNDLAYYGAVESSGNELFILGKDGNDVHIFTAGDRFDLSSKKTIRKTFFVHSQTNTGIVDLGDLLTISPTRIYASYHDDNGGSADQYRIVRFSPGNANTTDARTDTVELDSYFGGIGRLKKLNWIRFDIEPLKTGDVLEVYKELNYAGSWTRLDGTSPAGAENSIRESDFSGENRTTIKFTRGDQFRHMRLRFDWTGGSVKIRRIVVDWDYAE